MYSLIYVIIIIIIVINQKLLYVNIFNTILYISIILYLANYDLKLSILVMLMFMLQYTNNYITECFDNFIPDPNIPENPKIDMVKVMGSFDLLNNTYYSNLCNNN